jgi:hypothetical protein
MKKGDVIYAINECQPIAYRPRLTIGNGYIIEQVLDGQFVIKNDFKEYHWFDINKFDDFFIKQKTS